MTCVASWMNNTAAVVCSLTPQCPTPVLVIAAVCGHHGAPWPVWPTPRPLPRPVLRPAGRETARWRHPVTPVSTPLHSSNLRDRPSLTLSHTPILSPIHSHIHSHTHLININLIHLINPTRPINPTHLISPIHSPTRHISHTLTRHTLRTSSIPTLTHLPRAPSPIPNNPNPPPATVHPPTPRVSPYPTLATSHSSLPTLPRMPATHPVLAMLSPWRPATPGVDPPRASPPTLASSTPVPTWAWCSGAVSGDLVAVLLAMVASTPTTTLVRWCRRATRVVARWSAAVPWSRYHRSASPRVVMASHPTLASRTPCLRAIIPPWPCPHPRVTPPTATCLPLGTPPHPTPRPSLPTCPVTCLYNNDSSHNLRLTTSLTLQTTHTSIPLYHGNILRNLSPHLLPTSPGLHLVTMSLVLQIRPTLNLSWTLLWRQSCSLSQLTIS